MQNNIIPLVRRILAGLFSWLVIAIAALYLGGKILPHLGIGASLEMAFHSGLADQAVARLGNTFRISIHLNDRQ
jgi:hypothetical protein